MLLIGQFDSPFVRRVGIALELYGIAGHPEASEKWVSRCRTQIGGVRAALEADRAQRTARYWLGDALTHADIAVACVLRFFAESQPGAFALATYPALAAHSAGCESLPVFQKISQPFTV